jgi:hypothetical protein
MVESKSCCFHEIIFFFNKLTEFTGIYRITDKLKKKITGLPKKKYDGKLNTLSFLLNNFTKEDK